MLRGKTARIILLIIFVALIATPIARVVFSLLAFLWQRDWTYVMVTAIVLGLLVYSLFGRHSG